MVNLRRLLLSIKGIKLLCLIIPSEKKVEPVTKKMVVSLNLKLAASSMKLEKFSQAVEYVYWFCYVRLRKPVAASDDLVEARLLDPNNKGVEKT